MFAIIMEWCSHHSYHHCDQIVCHKAFFTNSTNTSRFAYSGLFGECKWSLLAWVAWLPQRQCALLVHKFLCCMFNKADPGSNIHTFNLIVKYYVLSFGNYPKNTCVYIQRLFNSLFETLKYSRTPSITPSDSSFVLLHDCFLNKPY